MPKYEIQVKTTGADQSANEIKKAQDALNQTGETAEKSSFKFNKLLLGLKQLGHEIPGIGILLHTLKNPFTLLGAAGVAAFVAIRKSMEEAREETDKWAGLSGQIKTSLDAYTKAAQAAADLGTAQKDLFTAINNANGAIQDQIKLLDKQIEHQIKVLEAEKELQATKIERDVADPVERARRLKENELIFGARIGGLRGSLPGQKAEILKRQLAGEIGFQAEAGAGIPTVEGLTKQVAGVEADRAALEKARRENVGAGQLAELLGMAAREQKRDAASIFNAGQIRMLEQYGVVDENRMLLPDKAAALLPHARAQNRLTQQRMARAQSSLGAGIGALPEGAVKAGILTGGITPAEFVGKAETAAAGLQNASYGRTEGILLQIRDLLAEQRGTVQLNNIRGATAAAKGDIAIGNAQAQAEAELTRRLAEFLKDVMNDARRASQSAPNR
jgi:hypothetical protein